MKVAGIFSRIFLKYKSSSFQWKILLNFAVLLVIFLLILYFVLAFSLANIKKGELALINRLNSQAVDRIESHLQDLISLTKQPLYDEELMNTFNRISQGHNYQENILQATIDKLMKSNIYMYSAIFFSTEGKTLASAINGSFMFSYEPTDEAWFQEVISIRGKPLVSKTRRFDNVRHVNVNNVHAFSVSRAMVDAATGRSIAVLSLYSDLKILREICQKTSTFEGERTIIIDSEFNLIYDTDEENITKSLKDTDLAQLADADADASSSQSTIAADSVKYIVMSVPVKVSGWRFIKIIPEDLLYKNTQQLKKIILILLVGFTMLIMAISILMSYEVTKPIKKLIKIMKLTEKGDLSVRFKTRYNDEIAQLGNSFNKMLGEITKLIDNVYDIEKKKRETELNALQMQINPHFIYNTLESVRMMAKVNDDDECSDMIFILSKMLRYSINTRVQRVTLNDEIEHLKYYMALQNLRFDNKFELNVRLEEGLGNMDLIKLILQPIVENAVYHALELVEEKGCIFVRAYSF